MQKQLKLSRNMIEIEIEHKTESEKAFDLAIEQGRLSVDPNAANYAGHYMYMGAGIKNKTRLKTS